MAFIDDYVASLTDRDRTKDKITIDDDGIIKYSVERE